MRPCIYQITNLTNGHFYIGSTVNEVKRKSSHFHYLKRNKHHSPYLQNAYNKYGHLQFEFKPIEYCNIEVLLDREQHYLETLSPAYNICKTASSVLGIKRSDETRLKMSKAMLGKKLSEEHKEKLRIAHSGKKLSEEHIFKIKQSLTGQKRSIEQNIKQSQRSTSKKPVLQICITTGVILREFDSIANAAKAFNVSPDAIGNSMKGCGKTSCGFIWKFKTKEKI